MSLRMSREWLPLTADLMESKLFRRLMETLDKRQKAGATIYPKMGYIFRAFDFLPPSSIKVVMLGQDPYHGPDQANGLAFSVSEGQPLPPSLRNIFTELKDDVGVEKQNGDLSGWAKQGVLLLNSILTVEKSAPASHAGIGWEMFTDTLLSRISRFCSQNLVFVLWGKHAQSKESYIDTDRHVVIKSNHPSPFSAYKGFFGSKPFSKINQVLVNSGYVPIDWSK